MLREGAREMTELLRTHLLFQVARMRDSQYSRVLQTPVTSSNSPAWPLGIPVLICIVHTHTYKYAKMKIHILEIIVRK